MKLSTAEDHPIVRAAELGRRVTVKNYVAARKEPAPDAGAIQRAMDAAVRKGCDEVVEVLARRVSSSHLMRLAKRGLLRGSVDVVCTLIEALESRPRYFELRRRDFTQTVVTTAPLDMVRGVFERYVFELDDESLMHSAYFAARESGRAAVAEYLRGAMLERDVLTLSSSDESDGGGGDDDEDDDSL